MANKRQRLQEERITAEMVRLEEVFTDIPKKTLKVVNVLIKNAAFMTVTLDDLQEKINSKGTVSKYKNGENQFGTKKSPEVETYNSYIKSLAAIIKQLTDLIPAGSQGGDKREPDQFEIIRARDNCG